MISAHASLFQVTERERERETLGHHSLVLQSFSPERAEVPPLEARWPELVT